MLLTYRRDGPVRAPPYCEVTSHDLGDEEAGGLQPDAGETEGIILN